MSLSRRPFRTLAASRVELRARLMVALMALLAVIGTAVAIPAWGYWTSTGSGSALATTGILQPATAVTVPATAAGDVLVSWTASSGPVSPEGYFVTRSTGTTSTPACGSSPTGLVAVATCTDSVVPEGTFSYVVTAVFRTWTAASAPSGTVTVTVPSLLGAAQSFSVLAGTAVVNTGTSTVSGDVGAETSVAGFAAGSVGGDVHVADAISAAAQNDLLAAFDQLGSQPIDHEMAAEMGGLVFSPGKYHVGAALALTTSVTLDAAGDPNAVFVFQTDAAFNTAAGSTVVLINGATADNIYWLVAGAAGTGAGASMSGSILAVGAITLGAGTTLIGRALSRDAVTLAGSTVRFTEALPPIITIDGGSTAATKDTTPTVTGTSTAPAASLVTVQLAGQTLTTTVGGDGSWSVTATPLAAARYAVLARVRDAAGNGSTASQLLTVEVNPEPVNLGTARSYGVLAATSITNTGATIVNGDLSAMGAVTGFPPGIVSGAVHISDATAAAAQVDFEAALDEVSARVAHTEIAGDLGGQTFHLGVHHQTAALALTGTVTLDAEGDTNAIFVFQTDAAFNTSAGSSVVLANGARAQNVYWVVAGAVGTGAGTSMSGTILARGAITLGASTTLAGRALSLDAVTLAGSTIT